MPNLTTRPRGLDRLKGPSAALVDWGHPLRPRDWLAAWHLRTVGDVLDISPGGTRSLTLPAANVTWGAGRGGGALVSDSTSNTSRVTFTSITPPSNYSIELLMLWLGGSAIDYSVLLTDGAAGSGLYFRQASGKFDVFSIADNLSNTVRLANVWYHYVATFSGGTALTQYVNGQADGSSTISAGLGSLSAMFSDTSSEKFNGKIEYLRIWNRVLTPPEIWWLYSEPYAMFAQPAPRRPFKFTPASPPPASAGFNAARARQQPVIGTGVF